MNLRPIFCATVLTGLFLGVWKDQLALWQDGSTYPARIYPCTVSSLPPEDRRLLEEGIPIRSGEELTARLEDFLS